MSYIGVIPAEAYASFYVQHFTTSATASYALDYPVTNENELRLVINNVVQQPGSGKAYTAAASTLTLSEATTSSDTMYAVFLGRALQTINPPAGSVGTSQIEALAVTSAKLASDSVITAKILDDNVTTAKILDNNVTLAKLADGTQGDILYYGASGAPALLGFGTSGDFLKTQGTGANPTWAAAGGAWTKLKAVTLAASTASVSFVNGTDSVVIDGTYRIYKIIVDGIKGYDSTDTYVRMRVYDGGTDGTGTSEVTASEYGYSNWWCTNHTADNSGLNYGNGYAYMVIGSQGNFDDTTGSGWSGEITAYNVNQTTADNCWKYINWTTSMVSSASLYFQQAGGGGGWKSTNTVRGFKIYPNAGTWDGGTFTLYGIE